MAERVPFLILLKIPRIPAFVKELPGSKWLILPQMSLIARCQNGLTEPAFYSKSCSK